LVQHQELGWQAVDGLPLFAQEWQPKAESQAVVCLVHGLGEHSGRYAHLAAALAPAGYALLAFDLRGHGRSGGPHGHASTYEVLLDDIALLLGQAAQRFPAQPRFLYGHSLGGNLALVYTLRRQPQLAGVISTSPLLLPAFDPPAWKVALGRVLYHLWPALALSNEVNPRHLARDPAVARAYMDDPLVHDRVSARLAMDMLRAGRWALEHATQFPRRLPLLLAHGSADRITSALASHQFAGRVPGDCTLKLWDDLCHETHNEPEQEAVFGFLLAWLRAHTPQR
jgi:acylglycerol lipase